MRSRSSEIGEELSVSSGVPGGLNRVRTSQLSDELFESDDYISRWTGGCPKLPMERAFQPWRPKVPIRWWPLGFVSAASSLGTLQTSLQRLVRSENPNHFDRANQSRWKAKALRSSRQVGRFEGRSCDGEESSRSLRESTYRAARCRI